MACLIVYHPLEKQKIYLEYKDGLKGELDLTKTIDNNNYDSLRDPEEFKKVFHNKKTNELCWPSGVCLCLNDLYGKLSLVLFMNRLKLDVDNE